MPSPLPSQLSFVLKVFVISAIASAVIKYLVPLIPLFANNTLAVSDLNLIAALAISLPVVIFALVLVWRKEI